MWRNMLFPNAFLKLDIQRWNELAKPLLKFRPALKRAKLIRVTVGLNLICVPLAVCPLDGGGVWELGPGVSVVAAGA